MANYVFSNPVTGTFAFTISPLSADHLMGKFCMLDYSASWKMEETQDDDPRLDDPVRVTGMTMRCKDRIVTFPIELIAQAVWDGLYGEVPTVCGTGELNARDLDAIRAQMIFDTLLGYANSKQAQENYESDLELEDPEVEQIAAFDTTGLFDESDYSYVPRAVPEDDEGLDGDDLYW